MPLLALIVAVAATVAGFTQAGVHDYPQWRGPHRDGSAAGFEAPASWPKALTRRWKADVGEGYATPLVVGDRVYAFTRIGGQETPIALEAATGAERWRSGYPAPYSPGPPAAAHGAGPKATPLYYEGKLFTLGISGIVTAFDAAAGKILWQTAPPAEAPFFGAASSPLGESGLAIVHPGNYGPLTAFDSATGAVKWTAGGDGFCITDRRHARRRAADRLRHHRQRHRVALRRPRALAPSVGRRRRLDDAGGERRHHHRERASTKA